MSDQREPAFQEPIRRGPAPGDKIDWMDRLRAAAFVIAFTVAMYVFVDAFSSAG